MVPRLGHSDLVSMDGMWCKQIKKPTAEKDGGLMPNPSREFRGPVELSPACVAEWEGEVTDQPTPCSESFTKVLC